MSAADFQVQWVRYGHRVFDRLARLRQPTIAVLSGHALGGGLELAVACDFRVAETQVKLGFPKPRSASCPAGPARSAPCAASARRRCGAWRWAARFFSRPGAGAGRCRPGGRHRQGLTEAKAWAEKIAERGPLATEAAKLMIAVAEGEESAAATEALASGFIA